MYCQSGINHDFNSADTEKAMEYLLWVCFMAEPWSQSNNDGKAMNLLLLTLRLTFRGNNCAFSC